MLANLLPSPLHPAIVHLPIALVLLLPFFALGAQVAIARGASPLRTWGLAAALAALLSVSAFVALETGEQQEDRVESIVPEPAFERHEESAEQFLTLSLAVLGVAALGLLRGRAGNAARWIATAGSVALLAAGVAVGHSGGELVYRFGAASAYVEARTTAAEPAATNGARDLRRDSRPDEDR